MAFVWPVFWQHCQTDSEQKITKHRSSLAKLFKKLQPAAPAGEIIEELAKIPLLKQQKYTEALKYLRQNFPHNIPQATIPPAGQAVPVNYQSKFLSFTAKDQYITVYDNSGGIELVKDAKKYTAVINNTWKSSSGNPGDLNNVASRELCIERTARNLPPFNHIGDRHVELHPDFRYAQPDNSLSNKMSRGDNPDDHSFNDPNYMCCSPRVAGILVMDQWYQYNVTTDPSEARWINIPGAQYEITKAVVQKGMNWEFQWRKYQISSTGVRNLLYGYEVPLGPLPVKWPKKITDFTL